MKQIIFILCVTLSFTGLSFFELNKVPFTLFFVIFVLYMFLSINRIYNLNFKVPKYLFVFFVYFLIVNAINYYTMKTSSFMFSLIIIIILFFLSNFATMFNVEGINNLCKSILFFYFVNIAIASIFILFNFRPTDLLGQIFQIYYDRGLARPFGFSSEPSYASIIIVFTLILFFQVNNYSYDKKLIPIYLMSAVTVILTNSSYGILLLSILIIYFAIKNNILSTTKLFFLIILLLPIFVILQNATIFDSINRVSNLLKLLFESGNNIRVFSNNLAQLDSSVNMRVSPSLILFDEFSKKDFVTILFGNGAGQSSIFFTKYFKTLDEDSSTIALGYFPSFIYNYGFLGVAISFVFFLRLFPKDKFVLLIFFFFVLFNFDFNTQIMLFILFIIKLSQHAEKLKSMLRT